MAFESEPLAAAESKYCEKYPNNLEIRLISDGSALNTSVDELKDHSERYIFRVGWKFDKITNSWKPPGEVITEPGRNPSIVTSFRILVDWNFKTTLPLEIIVGNEKINLVMSYAFDPFPEIIRWLELIIQGKSSRVLIDEEGIYHELISYAKEQGQIRLIITYSRRREVLLDVLINRRLVVEGFYNVVNSVINNPKFMLTWFSTGNRGPLDYKSELISEFLSK